MEIRWPQPCKKAKAQFGQGIVAHLSAARAGRGQAGAGRRRDLHPPIHPDPPSAARGRHSLPLAAGRDRAGTDPPLPLPPRHFSEGFPSFPEVSRRPLIYPLRWTGRCTGSRAKSRPDPAGKRGGPGAGGGETELRLQHGGEEFWGPASSWLGRKIGGGLWHGRRG